MRKPKKTDKTALATAVRAVSSAPQRENRSVFFGFLRFSPEAQVTLGQKDNNINREKTSLFLYTPLALRLRVRGGWAISSVFSSRPWVLPGAHRTRWHGNASAVDTQFVDHAPNRRCFTLTHMEVLT